MLKSCVATLVFLVCAVNGGVVEVQPCPNVNATIPLEYFVENCDASPCIIVNNTMTSAQVTFKVDRDLELMRTSLNVYLGPVTIPQELPADLADTCQQMVNRTCPVSADEIVQIRSNILVVTPIVGINVELEFKVVDVATNEPLVCFRQSVSLRASL